MGVIVGMVVKGGVAGYFLSLDVPANEDHAPCSSGVEPMAKGEQRGNREAKKPKKEKPKNIAAAPSTKGTVGAAVDSGTGFKRK